jgi:tRNA(His) 5'-end guanylyltransferase
MKGDSLGDRMKRYEEAVGPTLLRRTPVIIRVDGKAFHTFTRRLTKELDPTAEFHFSHRFHTVMMNVAEQMTHGIQGAKVAYTQSDEISILLRDWDTLTTSAWFDYKAQKVVSVAASQAAAYFNFFWNEEFKDDAPITQVCGVAQFDARVFNMPFDDVANYFIWRQKDAMRNSVNFVGRKYFPHKKLEGKKTSEVKAMLFAQHGVQWDEYPIWEQRGSCITTNPFDGNTRVQQDNYIPVFTEDRKYITRFLEIVDDSAGQQQDVHL